MTAVQESFIIQYFVRLWQFWFSAYRQSKTGDFFHRWGLSIANTVDGSAVCQFIWREGTLPQGWKDSLIFRVLNTICNIPCVVVRQIYKMTHSVLGSSLVCRFVGLLGRTTYLWMGLFVLVMLATPHNSWNNIYGLLFMIGVTVLFFIGSAKSTSHRLELDNIGPYLPLYMAWVCYGLIGSVSTSLSLRFFFFHLTGFLIVLVLVSSVNTYHQLHKLVALAVVGVTIAATYGCYQGLVQGVEVVASQQDILLNSDMPGRVYGFFDNPNNFAEVLVMLIPLNIALLLNTKSVGGKFLSLCALCPAIVAIGLTYSRSGWIGLALAIVIFLAFQNWRLVPIIIVAGVLSIPFLPESIYNRILTIGNLNDTSTQYRFAIYGAAANLLSDYWYRGVGLGNDIMSQIFLTGGYPTMFDGNYPIHTHNNYLQMWAEVGILGGITYIALLLSQLKTGVKAFCATTDRRVKFMLSASIGAFCGIMVIGVAEYTWFYPRNMFTYFVLFAIIGACVKLSKKPITV